MLRRILGELVFSPAYWALTRALRRIIEDIDRQEVEENPPAPEPFAVFEGRVTMNQISAPALSTEYKLGRYDKETGARKEVKPGKKIDPGTRLTTMIDDEDNTQQLTVRWEKGRGKIKMTRARKDEIWRIEFYKVAGVKEMAVPSFAGGQEGYKPYGGDGGGIS